MRNRILTRTNTLMIIDSLIALLGYFVAYASTLEWPQLIAYLPTFKQSFFILMVIYISVFYYTRIYEQMWRYADAGEYQRCALSSMMAGALFVVASEVAGYNVPIRIQIVSPIIIM